MSREARPRHARSRAGASPFLDLSTTVSQPRRHGPSVDSLHMPAGEGTWRPPQFANVGYVDDAVGTLALGLRAAMLQPGHSAATLFQLVQEAAAALGFEHCAYGLRLPFPFTQRTFLALNNYPSEWRARYADRGYVRQDPTVLHGARSSTPMLWSDALFSTAPEMWAEARSFGLRHGWAQSCFDAGGRVGLLSVARSHGPLTPRELAVLEPMLQWLVNLAHGSIGPVLSATVASQLLGLTPREREVMTWMADGKTAAEAGLILGIGERTVRFHVMNVVAKLQVSNKTSAVARAIASGLFD